MLRSLFRAALLRRLLQGSSRRSHRRHHHHGYGHRSHRGRGGGHWIGPFPAYSRRTRGGSRVTFTGCCLPIPLGMLGALAVAVRLLTRR